MLSYVLDAPFDVQHIIFQFMLCHLIFCTAYSPSLVLCSAAMSVFIKFYTKSAKQVMFIK